MPDDGLAGTVRDCIQNGEEVRCQLAVLCFDGEVVLVVAHDGDQHFLGEAEVLAFKAAGDDGRPLGKVRHLVDQGVVLAPAGVVHGAADAVERLANRVAA